MRVWKESYKEDPIEKVISNLVIPFRIDEEFMSYIVKI